MSRTLFCVIVLRTTPSPSFAKPGAIPIPSEKKYLTQVCSFAQIAIETIDLSTPEKKLGLCVLIV